MSTDTATDRKYGVRDLRRTFSARRVLLPVVLGLVAAAWLLYNDLGRARFSQVADGTGTYTWVDANGDGEAGLGDPAEFTPAAGTGNYRKQTALDLLRDIEWTWRSTFWLLLALMATAARDFGYMMRLRMLTDRYLGWRQSFETIMLWEFASAMTPSVVGGSGIAMFILSREGIPLGRSTAVVMVTALMDELFYVCAVPLVLLGVGTQRLFPPELDLATWGLSLIAFFWVAYAFVAALCAIMFLGVIAKPRAFKYLLLAAFKLPLLRRWRPQMTKVGDDIVTTSAELRERPKRFWLRVFGTTCLSWGARFLVINFLVMAFFNHLGFMDNLLIYARQLVLWVVLLIAPTPGASGVAEVLFSSFLRDLFPIAAFVGVIALLWRFLTNYLYLLLGAIVLPRWLRRTGKD
jgi:glycosyltransferase 2 family protein